MENPLDKIPAPHVPEAPTVPLPHKRHHHHLSHEEIAVVAYRIYSERYPFLPLLPEETTEAIWFQAKDELHKREHHE